MDNLDNFKILEVNEERLGGAGRRVFFFTFSFVWCFVLGCMNWH